MASQPVAGVTTRANGVAVPLPAASPAGEPTARAATVEVSGLRRAFGARVVLDALDLTIQPGEFVALLGRSGSGKSTLLRVLAGLDAAATGEHVVRGAVGVAFQEPRLLPWKRVRANVALGLDRPDRVQAADLALAEVGLADRADAWPLTLSGGEAQRVALARALVRGPDLLLLDEPFSALDALTRLAAHELVLDLWERRRPAVLLVTHDVDEAISLADRVLVLAEGRVSHASQVSSPRPRRVDNEFVALRTHLLAALGVRSHADATAET